MSWFGAVRDLTLFEDIERGALVIRDTLCSRNQGRGAVT